MSDMTTLEIGDREFRIGKPPVQAYLQLTGLIAGMYARGYTEQIKALGAMGAAMGKDLNDAVVFATGLAMLEEDDLYRLTAVLLHFKDVDEGAAWVEGAGWDLAWFIEVLTANIEHMNLRQLVKNVQRLVQVTQEQFSDPKDED